MEFNITIALYIVIVLGIIIFQFRRFFRRSSNVLGSLLEPIGRPQKTLQKLATELNIEGWGGKHGLQFSAAGNWLAQAARMEASPQKTFFRADQVMDLEDDGPMVSGQLQGRSVWLFSMVGRPRYGSQKALSRLRRTDRSQTFIESLLFSPKPEQTEKVMYLWSLEISTNSIPLPVSVSRRDLNEDDVINTESIHFEQRYNIHNTQDSLILQLLDPAMMALIIDSRVDAIEFSDSSVVLYELNKHISIDVLNAMLEAGLKIAEQVDRNYPLGKYEHGIRN